MKLAGDTMLRYIEIPLSLHMNKELLPWIKHK